MNMRGKLRSDDDGYAAFVGVMHNGYPLPSDGPVYQHLGRHKPSTVRPAHIHLIARAEGYEPLVTHVFPENDGHLLTDPVFGVRDDLVIPFTQVDKLIGNEPTAIIGPYWTAIFELRLSPNWLVSISNVRYFPRMVHRGEKPPMSFTTQYSVT